MRGKGINYDTGFINMGHSSRETFDLDVVRREIRIIRDDLHCNTIRVTGGDPAFLSIELEQKSEELGWASAMSIIFFLIILAISWVFYAVMTREDAEPAKPEGAL